MRFFQTIMFAAGLAAAVTIDDYPGNVVAGQTYTIKYSPATGGPTTFVLRQGDRNNLHDVATLTTTATGGTFQWTPSTSLTNEPNYALQVFQGTDYNYSDLIPLTGGSEEAASSSAPVSSAMASSAYSASMMSSAVSSASASASAASSESSEVSSIESSVSSVLASITSVAASASASITPSAGLNSTVTSATLSKSASASATKTKLPEVSTAAGNSLAQPMLAMLGAAAAFAYLA